MVRDSTSHSIPRVVFPAAVPVHDAAGYMGMQALLVYVDTSHVASNNPSSTCRGQRVLYTARMLYLFQVATSHCVLLKRRPLLLRKIAAQVNLGVQTFSCHGHMCTACAGNARSQKRNLRVDNCERPPWPT